MITKKQIIICILILAVVVFAIVFGIVKFGGKSNPGKDKAATPSYDPFDFCVITQNDNGTYTCRITDKNGGILLSNLRCATDPTVSQIDTYTLQLTAQAGTGLSTNWAVYCDVENSKLSDTFQYVLLAQGSYVLYAKQDDGICRIVVQHIFDKSQYYAEHVLSDCSAVASDFALSAKVNGDGGAIVTYLSGSDYAEKEITVKFPQ